MLTVSGTACTVCTSPDDLISVEAPEGAVTVTPNCRDPVVVPSVIELTVTVFVAESYVYAPTAPATSVPPTYTFTAPVGDTAVLLSGLGSMPVSVSLIVDAGVAADEYVRPAANPRTL